MTPVAKPVSIFCNPSDILPRRENTVAAPRLVPANGSKMSCKAYMFII